MFLFYSRGFSPFVMQPGSYCDSMDFIFSRFNEIGIAAKCVIECLKLGDTHIYNYLLAKGILILSSPSDEDNANLFYHLCRIDCKMSKLKMIRSMGRLIESNS